MLGLIAAEVAGVTGGTAPLLMGVAGAIICGWLGRSAKRMVQAIGTAFVGSFFIARGVACYAGGFSEMALPERGSAIDIKKNMGMWIYLGSVFVGTLIGSVVQLYIYRDEEKEDDNFLASEEEGRTCGCF